MSMYGTYAVAGEEDRGLNARSGGTPSPSINFLRAIPGGARPQAPEVAVAALVVGAFAFLMLVRKGFRPLIVR